MEISLNRLKNVVTRNSITNTIAATAEVKEDKLKPFNLVDWIGKSQLQGGEPTEYLSVYNTYLHSWYDTKGISAVDAKSKVAALYKTLLKNITINYSTDEERRWLRNIDLNDSADLDVALPFFSTRLKEIVLYFSKERDQIKHQKTKYDLIGSIRGVEKLVYNQVTNLIDRDEYILQYKSTKPSLSDFLLDFSVNVEELYDLSQDYFDVSASDTTSLAGDRGTYYKYQQIEYDPIVFINEDQAVISLIESYDTSLQNLSAVGIVTTDLQQIVASVSFTDDDVDELPDSEFINYIKDKTNLNILKKAELEKAHSGVNTYYLSAGSTNTEFVSGQLYSPDNPHRNLHNRYNASVNFFPDGNSIYSAKQIGRFFTPDSLGTLNYFSLSPKPKILTDKITPGTVYTYPDPEIYGSGLGAAKASGTAPIDHDEDVAWIKSNKSNDRLHGDIINQTPLQKFYPYTSKEEESVEPQVGISRSLDAVDFWSSDTKDVWSNEDVYTPLVQNTFDLQSRQSDLMVTDRALYNWKTDIYGNEYGLYKKIEPEIPANVIDPTALICETIDAETFDKPGDEFSTYNYYDGGRHPGSDPKPENFNPSLEFGSSYDYDGFDVIEPTYDRVSYGSNFLPDYCPTPPETYDCDRYDGGLYSYNPNSYLVTSSGVNLTDNFEDFDGGEFPDTYYFSTTYCDEELGAVYEHSIESSILYTPNPSATNTVMDETIDSFVPVSNLSKQSAVSGLVEFRNKYGIGLGSPLSEAFSAVFDRYSSHTELSGIYYDVKNNNIHDIDVIYDILVLYGSDYILFEKINFDYDTGKIMPSTLNNAIVKSGPRPLEKIIPLFYNEKEKYIMCGRTREMTTCNVVYPQLIKLDIETLELTTEFPSTTAEQLNFSLPSNLYQYSVSDIDTPRLSYNDTLNKYNITYIGKLDGTETGVPAVTGIYAFFSHEFKYAIDRLELADASVLHSDMIESIPQSTIKGTDSYTVSLSNNVSNIDLSTLTGTLSTYEFTLTVNPLTLSAGDYSFVKFMYDFGDGSDIVTHRREVIWDNPSALGTTDLDSLLKELGPDWGDPKMHRPAHTYNFESKITPITVSVSAVHSNFDTDVYTITFQNDPYSITSSVGSLKLIDTAYYTDINNNEKVLLTLETEEPKFISNVVLQKNLVASNTLPDLSDLSYTYTLVAGPGDTNNNLFYIHTSGDTQELKAKYSLGKGEYSVLIRSTDEMDSYTDKSFIVIIENDEC
jgi:hypothetical protein